MKRLAAAMFFVAALGAALFFYARASWAADTDFPIFFESSTLPLKSKSVNRVIYLPLLDIAGYLSLPYTDDFRLETFTLGTQGARLVTTRNSALISVNGQIILLQDPVRRDDGQWLVPLDFLSQGLGRITGMEFRYRPGTTRVFAGNVNPTELVMNAQALGPVTRLTIRTGLPVDLSVERDAAQRRAVLTIRGKVIDPLRERLDYKDRLIESVTFDDSEGIARILVNTTAEVHDIRATSSDENRVHFVDFLRESLTQAAPPPAAPPASPAPAAAPDIAPAKGLRVIVIDAGHGGIDNGAVPPGGVTVNPNPPPADAASTGTPGPSGAMEKDLTLTLARKLRSVLQSRLGATVLLTRDSDVALTNEARAAVANNNQAGLLISLHIGYSANTKDSGSSIYLVQDGFATQLGSNSVQDRLFLPWYLAYRTSRQRSERMAHMLQNQLQAALPNMKFPIRTGPIGVLASAAMPSVAIEVGNLNNPSSVQTLTDAAFQSKLAAAISAAVEQFASTQSAGRP